MIYFPEPYSQSKKRCFIKWFIFQNHIVKAKKKKNIKIHLDFTNYATKSDLKGATGINTSKFAKNADLASLKLDIEEVIGN